MLIVFLYWVQIKKIKFNKLILLQFVFKLKISKDSMNFRKFEDLRCLGLKFWELTNFSVFKTYKLKNYFSHIYILKFELFKNEAN